MNCATPPRPSICNTHRDPSTTMRPTHLLLLAVVAGCAATAHAESFCDLVQGDLPKECTCVVHGLGFIVDCQVSVFSDVIGVKMDVSPCATEASISIDVTEKKIGIDFPIAAIKAGTQHGAASREPYSSSDLSRSRPHTFPHAAH